MILVFDVYYQETTAKSVCLCFENWTDDKASQIITETIEGVAAYESGEFYKRELPCILKVLEKIDHSTVDLIIIDGYVVLDDTGKFGLGGHLYESLNGRIPIVGVAKTNFATNHLHVRPVVRGESIKPLFVTAIGIDLDEAAQKVKNMHGEYRIPTLLKEVDHWSRT